MDFCRGSAPPAVAVSELTGWPVDDGGDRSRKKRPTTKQKEQHNRKKKYSEKACGWAFSRLPSSLRNRHWATGAFTTWSEQRPMAGGRRHPFLSPVPWNAACRCRWFTWDRFLLSEPWKSESIEISNTEFNFFLAELRNGSHLVGAFSDTRVFFPKETFRVTGLG